MAGGTSLDPSHRIGYLRVYGPLPKALPKNFLPPDQVQLDLGSNLNIRVDAQMNIPDSIFLAPAHTYRKDEAREPSFQFTNSSPDLPKPDGQSDAKPVSASRAVSMDESIAIVLTGFIAGLIPSVPTRLPKAGNKPPRLTAT
jgi:hypothetical protein